MKAEFRLLKKIQNEMMLEKIPQYYLIILFNMSVEHLTIRTDHVEKKVRGRRQSREHVLAP